MDIRTLNGHVHTGRHLVQACLLGQHLGHITTVFGHRIAAQIKPQTLIQRAALELDRVRQHAHTHTQIGDRIECGQLAAVSLVAFGMDRGHDLHQALSACMALHIGMEIGLDGHHGQNQVRGQFVPFAQDMRLSHQRSQGLGCDFVFLAQPDRHGRLSAWQILQIDRGRAFGCVLWQPGNQHLALTQPIEHPDLGLVQPTGVPPQSQNHCGRRQAHHGQTTVGDDEQASRHVAQDRSDREAPSARDGHE